MQSQPQDSLDRSSDPGFYDFVPARFLQWMKYWSTPSDCGAHFIGEQERSPDESSSNQKTI